MKIILSLLLLINISFAADLPSVSSGQNIQASSLNLISQVINSILNIEVPSGENVYTAKINSTGGVYSENVDWISGNCSNTGVTVCPFNTNFFSIAPSCSVSQGPYSGSPGHAIIALETPETATSVSIGFASLVKRDFRLICQRQGSDYKPYRTIRQILVNAGLTFLQ